MHGSDAFKALEIPQLDSHVCGAGCKQLPSLVKRDILYRVRVALQCAFKISRLVIPHLQDKTFIRRSNMSSRSLAIPQRPKKSPLMTSQNPPFPFEFIRILHASTHFQLTMHWQLEIGNPVYKHMSRRVEVIHKLLSYALCF